MTPARLDWIPLCIPYALPPEGQMVFVCSEWSDHPAVMYLTRGPMQLAFYPGGLPLCNASHWAYVSNPPEGHRGFTWCARPEESP